MGREVGVEAQGGAERVEHLLGGIAVPALLKPGQIGEADARERGQLVAAQPGHAAPADRGQPGVLRAYERAAGLEKAAESVGAGHVTRHCTQHRRVMVTLPG